MFSRFTRSAKRRTAALTILATAAVCGTAVSAATTIKDAKFGVYTRWGADKMNVKLDKVAHVTHLGGGPYTAGRNPDATYGYTIYEFTFQNPGEDPEGIREPGISAIYDDESEIDGNAAGPYAGTGTTYFRSNLQHLQTVHIRWVQFKTPLDHKLTKIILDPNDGGPKLRYTVKDANVEELPDIPPSS